VRAALRREVTNGNSFGAFQTEPADIAILRSLRKAARGDKQELVITSGEILRDEDLRIDFDLQDRMADTKVRTAISWLERASLLQRDENVTNVFQARPLVRSLAEAQAKIAGLNLSATEQSLWIAIIREIFNTPPTESLTVDRLALLPEFSNYAKGNQRVGTGSGQKI
jgi:ATP-dependent DNA helicase RecQ